MSGTKTAELYRMVMEDHLCPYGLKSKHLLETQGFQVEDHHLKNHEETEAFKHKHNVETTPQTFLGGNRIGGYDDLLVYFRKEPKDKNEQTYWPVIALFSMTFLMATGSASVVEGQWLSLRTLRVGRHSGKIRQLYLKLLIYKSYFAFSVSSILIPKSSGGITFSRSKL